MTESFDFTDEQKELINQTGSVYVEACPGAGKTQTIVERFAVRPNKHPRKGVALLSFTNAAAEEARKRCGEDPHLIGSPNFIGTIDQFINRFIVGPDLNSGTSTSIHYVPSWDHLPNTVVHSGSARDVQIGWFDYDDDSEATLNLKYASSNDRRRLNNISASQLDHLQQQAKARRQQLLGRGYYSAEAARQKASFLLRDPDSESRIIDTISNRFFEVIVDEVQDCSNEDLELLRVIKRANVNLVLVGDPDQAIYGFRHTQPADSSEVGKLVPKGKRLSGNFRSTPAICKLADGLREADDLTDQAIGVNQHVATPVLVFGFGSRSYPKVQACIQAVGREYEHPHTDTIVLAHRTSTARAAAGNRKTELTTTSKLARIAYSVETIASTKDPALKARALRTLSLLFHECASNSLRELDPAEFFEAIGYNEREYRTRLLRICTSITLDRALPPSDFQTQLLAAANANGLTWLQRRSIVASSTWPTLPEQSNQCFDYGTIHSYKGLQKPFVCVVHPKHTGDGLSVSELWKTETSGEPRRVLYVGSTRAEQTLLLAVDESHLADILECLERDNVPVRLIDINNGKVVDR